MTFALKLAFLIFAVILAVAQASNGRESISDSNKCALELEAILYRPKTCAFKYLRGLEVQFRKDGGNYLIFTPQAGSYISTFVNTFRIVVSVADAFGRAIKFFPDGSKAVSQSRVFPNTAQSYLNHPGFVRQVSDQKFYYTFGIFSQDAQYIAVTFEMPLADDPIACN